MKELQRRLVGKTTPTQAPSHLQVGAYPTAEFSGSEEDGSPDLAALLAKNLRRSRPCPEFTGVSGSQVRMATQPLVLCSNKQPSWTEDFEIFLFKHAEFMCLLRHLRHYKNILQRLDQTLPQSLCTFPKTPGPSESPRQLRSLAPVPPAPQAHISNSFTQNDRTLPPPLTPPSPFTATTTAMLFLAALCVPLPFSSVYHLLQISHC